jgi:hypothetical protein
MMGWASVSMPAKMASHAFCSFETWAVVRNPCEE